MLETVIENMIEKLSTKKKLAVLKLEIHLDPSARFILGDPTDLRHLFYHLVENAAAAASSSENPPACA